MPKKILKTRSELLAEFDSFPLSARLTEAHVAAARGCSTALLQRERCVTGSPIPFLREGGRLTTGRHGREQFHGGRIFYLKRDVVDYLERRNQTFMNTAQAALVAEG